MRAMADIRNGGQLHESGHQAIWAQLEGLLGSNTFLVPSEQEFCGSTVLGNNLLDFRESLRKECL